MLNSKQLYSSNYKLQLKTYKYFEKEHRYTLQQIYNRIRQNFSNIDYEDIVWFALDNTTLDNKQSELLKRYNE
jgi:transcriptional regulator CtsR